MGISDEIEFASIAFQLMKRRSHCYSILHSCNVGKQMWPNLLKSALHFHSLVLLVKPIAFLICSSLLATQNRLKTRRRIDGKRPAKSTSASAGTNSKEDHSKPKILGSREPSPGYHRCIQKKIIAREGISGRWPGSVNFTKFVFRSCN